MMAETAERTNKLIFFINETPFIHLSIENRDDC
jgi:hypothetical protein